MKKLLLLITVGLVAGGVNAQEAQNLSVVRTGNVEYKSKRALVDPRIEAANKKNAEFKAARNAATATSANKGTAGNARVYNWSDYLKNVRTMSVSNPYMWFNGNGMGIYSNATGGLEVDSIQLASLGMAITPWSSEFNDAGVPGYFGKIALNSQSPYQVDSIVTYGFYGRNPAKTAVVDTMIFSLTYGPGTGSVRSVYFTNYNGIDTLRCLQLGWDAVNNTAGVMGTGATVEIKKVALRLADSSTGRIAVDFNRTIPAGNAVGATVTFKSGDPDFVPYTDTVFAGSATPNRPFKFGMWRPAMYEETSGQFPQYTKGNQISAQSKFIFPNDTSGYKDFYVPVWAYVPAFSLEWPDVDFVISSTNPFATVGIENVNSQISGVSVYPNPSATEINVRFNLNSEAKTTVSVKSVMGQVIATHNMGTVANGVATFSTANLSNGVYFCTVESNGQQQTSRFVVAH